MEGFTPDTLARAAKTGTGDDPTYRAEETEEPETQAHVEATKQIQRAAAQEDKNPIAMVDEWQ